MADVIELSDVDQREVSLLNEDFFNKEHIDLAAMERTFDASYLRSALNSIVTGIFIFKIFQHSFSVVAILYLVFGGVIGLVAIWRRYVAFHGNYDLSQELIAKEEDVELEVVREQQRRDSSSSVEELLEHNNVTVIKARTKSPVRVKDRVQSQITERKKEKYDAAENARLIKLNQEYFVLLEKERIKANLNSVCTRKIVDVDGMKINVCLPLDAPKQTLSHEYYEWRSEVEMPPSLPYVHTSGLTVMIITLIVSLFELLVMGFMAAKLK